MTSAGRSLLLALGTLLTLTFGPLLLEATAKATEINKCTTIAKPGSYILKESLTASGDCIKITADDVTFDLDGQTRTGNWAGAGVTDGVARQGIVIRNGTNTIFSDAINLGSSTRTLIEPIQAISIGNTGIRVGNSNTLRYNIAIGNVGDGMEASFNTTITDNTANNNGKTGLEVSLGSAISYNHAHSNSIFGIDAGCSAGSPSHLIGNTALFNRPGQAGPNTSTFTNCVIPTTPFKTLP